MIIYHNHKTHPYTAAQLSCFEEEIKQAGGFKELMIKKEALKRKNSFQYAIQYHYPFTYQEKYLVDVYKSLRHIFTTETPYAFWKAMYEKLKSVGNGKMEL